MRSVAAQIELQTPPINALRAFTNLRIMGIWWGVQKCFIDPQPGGQYVLSWGDSQKITFCSIGRIMKYDNHRHLMLDQMVYINPSYPILGPMELMIEVMPDANGTILTVEQSGYQKGPNWDWYFAATQTAWPRALDAIKQYFEQNEKR